MKNGVYTATFAGFFSGTGKADVNAEKISITASLTTTDGRTGDLIANNLTVEGPYFNGTGTVLGETVQISGRVDAALASRLTATIFAGDGRASRAVANLPAHSTPATTTGNNPQSRQRKRRRRFWWWRQRRWRRWHGQPRWRRPQLRVSHTAFERLASLHSSLNSHTSSHNPPSGSTRGGYNPY